MDDKKIRDMAHDYIIKKCNDFDYTDLVIHSENVKNKEEEWILEADISFKWKLHGWEKEVRETVVGVLVNNKWKSPNFYCED